MNRATFRFYAQLNDFLPVRQRHKTITYRFGDTPAVKDSIEAIGVPHPEVALILANGEPVDFAYLLQAGDRITVYPTFRQIDISSLLTVQPPAPQAFIADVHLGRLVAYMRMLGFDTLLLDDHRDELIAATASRENRIVLTRDVGLLKRSIVTHGYFIRATKPWRQLAEVIDRFNLGDAVMQFHRCTNCNDLLHVVDKTDIEHQLPDKTVDYYDEFRQCRRCQKIYWRGSHYAKLDAFLAKLSLRTGSR